MGPRDQPGVCSPAGGVGGGREDRGLEAEMETAPEKRQEGAA